MADPDLTRAVSTDPNAGDRRAVSTDVSPSAPPPVPSLGSRVQSAVNTVAEFLPAAGGIVGSWFGGPPGAVMGGGAGEGYKQLAQHITEIPGAVVDVARNLVEQPRATIAGMLSGEAQGAASAGTAGAVQGATEAIAAPAVNAVASPLSKWLMNRATTRVTAKLLAEFPELSDTLIDNALTVSKGGEAKARALLALAKGKAVATVAQADAAGAQIPVSLTSDLAENLKTALLQKAIKEGRVPAPPPGQPITVATARLDPATTAFFQQIDHSVANGTPIALKPSEADVFKTQLQKQVRNPVYLNSLAINGPKAVAPASTLMADYAARLNEAIDGVASGYRAANAQAQPLIGAVRGLAQATRSGGNLYQAMVRPALGGVLGGVLGETKGGHQGAAIGSVLGAIATSPANLSREAIVLGHPAVQTALSQIPKPFADRVRTALLEALTPPPPQTSSSGSTP